MYAILHYAIKILWPPCLISLPLGIFKPAESFVEEPSTAITKTEGSCTPTKFDPVTGKSRTPSPLAENPQFNWTPITRHR